MSSEVGSGHVAIFPEMKGFRRGVSSEVDASAKVGKAGFARVWKGTGTGIGAAAGKEFGKGFTTSTKGIGAAATKQLSAEVASASRAVSVARLKEQDATGKVRVAEAQLNEARQKGAAGSSQVIRAEERLAAAARSVSAAQDMTRSSSDRLRAAQEQLKAATTNAALAATSAGSGFRGAMSNATSIFSSGGRSSGLGFAGGLGGVLKGGIIGGLVAGVASSVLGGIGNVLGDAVGRIETGLSAAVKTSIDFNSQLENATIGFTTMLGSGQKAATFLNGLKSFALSTPFEFTDLVKNSQYLLGMGVNAKNVIPSLRALGDSVAATGGNADVLNNTIAAFGQLTAKSTLDMGNLNQLLQGGVPSALKILAAGFHTSTGGIVDMISQGKILSSQALPLLIAGIEKGTSKTAALGGMMAKQSQTFSGAMSNINDTVQQGLGTALQPLFKVLESIVVKVAAFAGSTGFQTFIQGIASSVGTLVNGDTVAKVGGFFQSIFNNPAVAGAGKDLLAGIGPAFTQIGAAIQQAAPFVAQFAQQVLPPLLGNLGSILSHSAGFIGFLGQISPALAPIGGVIAGVIGFLAGFQGTLIDIIGSVGRFVASVASGFQEFSDRVTVSVALVIAGVIGFVSDCIAAFGRFATGVGTNIGKAIDFVTSLPGKALDALGDIGSKLFHSGAALIGGFVDGIRSAIGSITKVVGDAMAAAGAFFPHSPAKKGTFSGKGWTPYSGKALGFGFADGLDSTVPRISSAAAAATRAAQLVSTTGASSIGSSGSYGGTVTVELHNKTGINLVDFIDVRVNNGITKFSSNVARRQRMGRQDPAFG